MKTIKPGLEAISIRRTSIADANKVRYRVYTSANEFTVVVAESALMAVRASGVKVPHKIVREMPGEGGKIEAQKLVKEESAAPVAVNPHNARPAREEMKQLLTELAEKSSEESILFVPMDLADMRSKGMSRARILPAEMLQEIIEEHVKTHPPEVAAPVAAPVVETPPVELHRPPPEPSQAEKVAALADQVLQPISETPAEQPAAEPELSPEEVQKLLNE